MRFTLAAFILACLLLHTSTAGAQAVGNPAPKGLANAKNCIGHGRKNAHLNEV